MTPETARQSVADRLTAAGLTEARSPIGVRNESSPRIDRSFAVLPKSADLSRQRGRDRQRARMVFAVELCHKMTPSEGQAAPSEALRDYAKAVRFLLQRGTDLTAPAAIEMGAASFVYAGGGAYMVTAFDLIVSFDFPLDFAGSA